MIFREDINNLFDQLARLPNVPDKVASAARDFAIVVMHETKHSPEQMQALNHIRDAVVTSWLAQ